MSVDYKSTVFLPKSDFAMKANLANREPEHLARWEKLGLFDRLRAQSKGREKFILHDGPPYANGHLHLGTALNKILKDVINRSQQMLGKDANYVPGWDCHGLPIEWKIEEQYRKAGKNKDEVPVIDFRRECREFAEKWIDIQREEFKRLGVIGDWDNPYTTMTNAAEAQIAAELMKFAKSGQLYRGSKPVMWSVVEKTALAEAEIEYHDHESTTIYARFPVAKASVPELDGAAVVIWTTTPWTIPGNRALAYGEELSYVVERVTGREADSPARDGETLVVAEALLPGLRAAAGITESETVAKLSGAQLAGTVCRHPLDGKGYDFDVPMFAGDFVTAEEGTGVVHIAPGHGADDWILGTAHGIEVPQTVGEDGRFYDPVPLFAGKAVYWPNGKVGNANEAVVEALTEAGALLGSGKLVHSYPHSWRSKAPLIFRNTPQWFIAMGDELGADGLRAKALKAIDETRFVPASGQNRLRGMIEQRPDWVISRQRAWGVPITVFVNRHDERVLDDPEVDARIVEAFREGGADTWFADNARRFLGDAYDADEWEKVEDILDVWFDSGSTHAFVLEQRPELEWPASLYLEGSDQHRGWFHSSLLESCGTRGRAPYEAVLTHGFVMAEDGRKMSKSLGNIVSPQSVVQQNGADVLRLWVVSSDYTEDLRIGPDILKHQTDMYRRLRNTLRFLIGNLNGFGDSERVAEAEMPELERWVLHRLYELDRRLRRTCESYEFHAFYAALHAFCAVDLSAFFFDIRKDSLYCDRVDEPRRRAARTVMDAIFSCLTAWLAPALCFTAEEAWLARYGEGGLEGAESVHLRLFPDIPESWRDDELAAKWDKVRALRRVVTGALELERAEKRIGSSLQANPIVYARPDHIEAMQGLDLAEIAITSDATLTADAPPKGAFVIEDVDGVAVRPGLAEGDKCERCFKVLPEVGASADWPGICHRCVDAVEHFRTAAD